MKATLKSVARSIAILVVLPVLVSHRITAIFVGADTSLESHSQLLSLIPGISGSYLRVAFYRFALQHCDPSATISFGTLFSKTTAVIERNVYIGPRCMLGDVTLEEDVLLGPAVQIPSGPSTHGFQSLETPIRLQPGQKRHVTVGRDSWIGASAIILADIASQCVVGAASVVTKATEPCSIVVGNSAKRVAWRGAPSKDQ
ncbi:MAG: acyltransferase [Planctomycetota bacterium]